MKKIAIFILILVLIGGGYYWINTNSKTFVDEQYGFSFKIPGNWESTKSVNERGQTVYLLEDKNNVTTKIGINVPIDPNSKPNTSAVPQRETINGYDADHYIIGQNSMELYVIRHNNTTLWMMLSYNSDTMEIVKKILSSFKYI